MMTNTDSPQRSETSRMENFKNAARKISIVVPNDMPDYIRKELDASMHRLAKKHDALSLSFSVVCRPCKGDGWVDDGTGVGCVRRAMDCPDCKGTGKWE